MIVFINSYTQNKSNRFALFSPVFPPIGVGYLASVAQKKGIDFKIFDQQIHSGIERTICKEISFSGENVVFAFSVLTSAFESAIKTASFIKQKYPGCLIIFGGIHPTAMPEEVLKNGLVDIAVRGEGEHILFDIYEKYINNKPWTDISGISYVKNSSFIHNPDSELVGSLDDLPVFPYELFENIPRYDLGVILSSRGCKRNCFFCSNSIISKKNVRYISASNVIETIVLLIEKYRKNHILFLDDNFLEDKERITELARSIREKKLNDKCSFSFQARCDQVDHSILNELYLSGFRTVFFGIETISENLLKKIHKGQNPSSIKNAVRISSETGFKVQASFIFGFPDETYEDRIKTLNFAVQNPIDIAKFNNVVPYPGTSLYHEGLKENRILFNMDYSNADTLIVLTDGLFTKRKLPFKPDDKNNKSVKRFIILSYLVYYFNFSRIKNIFCGGKDTIKWMYIKDKKKDFINAKVFPLILLSLRLFIRFSAVFFYLSKENYFYYSVIKRKMNAKP